jgi:protein-arginine kinase activator protein McsA
MFTEVQKQSLPFELQLRVYTLENTMEAAVAEENYEIAAECRNKISEIFELN